MDHQENLNPQASAETVSDPATQSKKKKAKIIVKAIAVTLTILLLIVGTIAFLINFVIMPNPVTALTQTLGSKYHLDTSFDFKTLRERGSIEATVELERDNALNRPRGTISASVDYRGNQAILHGEAYKHSLDVYLSPDLVAAHAEKFDSNWYGTPLKNFRTKLAQSEFAPNSGSEYEMDPETFEKVCNLVELIVGDEGVSANRHLRENQDDLRTVAMFFKDVFEDSKISNTQKDYGTKKIIDEKRWIRSETYTIDRNTLEDLLRNLKNAMRCADADVIEAAERLLGKLHTVNDFYYLTDWNDWEDLEELVRGAIDNLDMGDTVISVEICYKNTVVSAIMVNVVKDYGRVKQDIVIDFGSNPSSSVDTRVWIESLRYGVESEAELILTEKREEKKVTYTLNGSLKGDFADYTGTAVLVLDRGEKEATLDVAYTAYDEKTEVLSAVCGYVDTRNTWGLTFRELTWFEQDYDADELGVNVSLTISNKPEKITKPEYKNMLEWNEKKVENFAEDIEIYFEQVVEEVWKGFTLS